ncbi:MAG: hypothetical protein NBV61_08475 [Algoriphagus sp.]|jgi:hypothetical protein|nr:hypothetical protein [Algoriphagus sp.]
MKILIFFLASTFFATYSFGQSAFKRNDVYFEAGGNGLFSSINYERQLTSQPGLGVRIGLGFYSENAFYLTIPTGVNYLFKLKNDNSFIDAGLGATWTRKNGGLLDIDEPNGENFMNFVPSIGYRKHTANDVMWRISLAPVANKYGLVPWLGLSLGKRF